MLAGILETISRFTELPPSSIFLPSISFTVTSKSSSSSSCHHLRVRHVRAAPRSATWSFLVRTARPTACRTPERTLGPVSQRRAAFPWWWSSGKGWFPDSSSACPIPIPSRLLPPLHAIAIAVEHQSILFSLRPENCRLGRAACCSTPRAVVVARREPLWGWLGGRKASWSDSPPKNVLSSSSVQYVSTSRTFPDFQNQRFYSTVGPNRQVENKFLDYSYFVIYILV